MKQQTFERFQGMWWGGVVGQAIANQNNNEHPGIITFPQQNWLEERRRIGEILLKSTRGEEIRLSNFSGNILSLLALIIFYDDNQKLFYQIVNSSNLSTEVTSDILTWGYLLNSLVNKDLKPWQLNHDLLIEGMLNNLEGQSTKLIQQFKYVIAAVNQGKSLHHLLDKLLPNGNIRQMAIALSWYCFVTTPDDFRISVQRAALIQSDTAGLLAALTGTFSGAYNSMMGIPLSWMGKISHDQRGKITQSDRSWQQYHLENEVLVRLGKAWRGTYSLDSNQELYNPKLDAVANPQTIQPRQTLNIISQTPRKQN